MSTTDCICCLLGQVYDATVDTVRILSSNDDCPALPIIETGGSAHAVVWPGVGAIHRSMHMITLDRGGRTKALMHPSAAVYHLCEGAAILSGNDLDESWEIGEGAMFHVDAGTTYRLEATADGTVLIGGPCPPDPAMYQQMED